MITRRHRIALLACVVLAVAATIAPAAVQLPAWIVFNPSASVARGWYRVDAAGDASSLQESLQVGSIVLARLPAGMAAFAAQRGYLPEGVPILKRIGAMASQSVCVVDRLVWIDGVPVAGVLAHDGAHRPLPPWTQCRMLMQGELFLLSDTQPASFDSRYFGPVDAADVLGVARPLWTW